MVAVLIYFLLFILPFIIYPYKVSPYEKPKVIFAEIAIQFLTYFSFFAKDKIKFSKIGLNLLMVLGIIGGISIFHIIFSAGNYPLFGNPIRLQGTLLLWHMLAFAIVSSQIAKIKIPPLLPVLSALALLMSSVILNTNINGRAVGTLGEPNALAAVAIFIWPFIFFLEKFKKKIDNLVKFGAVVFATGIIYISQSKSALIALLIQLILLALVRLIKIPASRATLFALILVILSYFLPIMQRSKILENRLEVWQVSVKSAFQKPFLGWGFGNIEFALEKTAKSYNYNFVRYQYVDSAHNLWLDWWIQAGFVGLFAIIYLVLKSLFNLAEQNNQRELLAFLGIIITTSFNPASVATLVAFWWLIGKGFYKK